MKGPRFNTIWLLTVTYASVGFSIYFALGVVAKRGLGLTPLIFLGAGLLFVLTMFTHLEGSTMLRERGGSSALARHAFNELVAFVAGWVILLDYLIVIALAVLTVPRYLEPITGNLDGTLWAAAVSAGVLIYITTLNVLDITGRRRSFLLIFLAAVDLFLQLLVVVVGAIVVMHPDRLVDHIHLFTTPGLGDVVYAAALSLLAYAGIEAVSNLVPDLNLDARDFSRSVTRSIWLVPVLYAAMAAVALMAVPVVAGPDGPATRLGGDYVNAPILGVVSSYHPDWLREAMRWLVSLIAVPTLIWAANMAMLGFSRHTYTLAVNRQIPSWIGQLGRRYAVPYKAIMLGGLAVFGFALIGSVELLAGIYAFGATLAMTIAHFSVIKLRRDEPDRERPFRVPLNVRVRMPPAGDTQAFDLPLPALLAGILSLLALISVLILHDMARWVGGGWLVFGLLAYIGYRKWIEQVSLTQQVTVAPEALTRPKVSIGLHKIIVPIFGTSLDDDIVATAGRLAAGEEDGKKVEDAELTVLYLIEVPLSQALDAELDEEIENKANAALARARAVAEEYEDVHVRAEIVRTRQIGSGIIEAAGRREADAIVLGAEPPTNVKGGWVLGGVGESRTEEIGPVTAYVLKRSTCRVLLTAPPG